MGVRRFVWPFLYCSHIRLYLTAVMSGIRLGELLAMRWKNLDWEGGQYHVKERLYIGEFDTPKNEGSRRAVDLIPSIIDVLRVHRNAQNEIKLLRV